MTDSYDRTWALSCQLNIDHPSYGQWQWNASMLLGKRLYFVNAEGEMPSVALGRLVAKLESEPPLFGSEV